MDDRAECPFRRAKRDSFTARNPVLVTAGTKPPFHFVFGRAVTRTPGWLAQLVPDWARFLTCGQAQAVDEPGIAGSVREAKRGAAAPGPGVPAAAAEHAARGLDPANPAGLHRQPLRYLR
jgi:hypothetical protein